MQQRAYQTEIDVEQTHVKESWLQTPSAAVHAPCPSERPIIRVDVWQKKYHVSYARPELQFSQTQP
jgi:superoxide dismutase